MALVVILLGAILSAYGWHDAAPGRPNTFLNFDNLVDGVATLDDVINKMRRAVRISSKPRASRLAIAQKELQIL